MKQVNYVISLLLLTALIGCSTTKLNGLDAYATFISKQSIPDGENLNVPFETIAIESMNVIVTIQKGVHLEQTNQTMILNIPENTILGASLTRFKNDCIISFNNLHLAKNGYYFVNKQINCNDMEILANKTKFEIRPFEFIVTPD